MEVAQYYVKRPLGESASCMTGRAQTNPGAAQPIGDSRANLYLPAVFSEAEWRACSRANWFWLVNLPGYELAVELSPGPPTLDEVSRSRFESIRHFDLTSSPALPLPISNGTVDCIFLQRAWNASDASRLGGVLTECGRTLRPGGNLICTIDHRAWGRSSMSDWVPRALLGAPSAFLQRWSERSSAASAAPWPLQGLARQLHAAGFSEVRTYYALPTIDAPQQLVPAQRDAMAIHLARQPRTGVRGVLRQIFVVAGLEALLFPGFLVIAVR